MTRRNVPATGIEAVASTVGAPPVSGATVTGVSDDSRTVAHGDLFLCIRGASVDGHSKASDAVSRGAVALVVDTRLDLDVPQVVVPDVRAAVGPVVSTLLGTPSTKIRTVGVTGTNGKTSTVTFVAGLLSACGARPTVIGTLTGVRTTPEPLELQGLLADAVTAGDTHCVMEVSSHAMVMHRADGIVFDVCAFTNLGRDHLDFHASMEDYFAAKASLFEPAHCATAVVNTDDDHGRTLATALSVPCATVSAAMLADIGVTATSVSFTWRSLRCHAPVGGTFSVVNLHLALEICVALGMEPTRLAEACSELVAPAGRFESVPTAGGYNVIVDYAHTPEALAELLRSVRALGPRNVTVVFGCGGDRDPGKRPAMGAVAAELADRVVVTSDNPRSEDPHAIIAAVVAGTSGGTAVVDAIEDRAAAIESAISGAGSGDIVVIAGKGHESHQEIHGRLTEFSDTEVARNAVRRKDGTR